MVKDKPTDSNFPKGLMKVKDAFVHFLPFSVQVAKILFGRIGRSGPLSVILHTPIFSIVYHRNATLR